MVISSCAVLFHQLVPKRRDIPVHRIPQLQNALFPQHHGRHSRHRFGHGKDPEQCIRLHSTPALPVRQSVCLAEQLLLILINANAGTCDLSLRNATLHNRRNTAR